MVLKQSHSAPLSFCAAQTADSSKILASTNVWRAIPTESIQMWCDYSKCMNLNLGLKEARAVFFKCKSKSNEGVLWTLESLIPSTTNRTGNKEHVLA